MVRILSMATLITLLMGCGAETPSKPADIVIPKWDEQATFTQLKEAEAIELGVIPQLSSVAGFEGQVTIPKQVAILDENLAEPEGRIAEQLTEMLKGFGIDATLDKQPDMNGFVIRFEVDDQSQSIPVEGYRLAIHPQGITISSSDFAGLFYGVQTLRQLLPAEEGEQEVGLPLTIIDDYPRLKWRGLHLDVCRHFMPIDFVKKYIDEMSKYKFNTFHWHLTEDQGWRIEIKQYPKLTEVGAMRKETIVEKNFDPYVGDGIPHGGFYTQEQVKEVVAYAAERYVTVVPEIEMPGHSLAALAAYPEFSCQKGDYEVLTRWGISDEVYCTTDTTFTFLTNILDEVVELFPSEYIHIGGDEAPKKRWKTCEHCQRRIKEEGLKDEHELQSYFVKRIEKHLNGKGRKLIGWDEILEGGLSPNATVMSWRGEAGGIAAANEGHDVVMTPGFALYFDHYQGPRESEPLAIGGFSDLHKVYHYDPVTTELPEEKRKHIIGVQANCWTEYMPNSDHVEYMVYPRALALSEIAWTAPQGQDWESFQSRIAQHYPRLEQDGINYRKPQPTDGQNSGAPQH